MFNSEIDQQTIQTRRAAEQAVEELLAAGVLEQHQDPHLLNSAFMFGTISKAYSHLDYSSSKSKDHLAEVKQSLGKDTEELEDSLEDSSMAPNKKVVHPSSDSHNSNFALVNYESNQQTVDEHTELENNTFSFSRLHWTDSLELILVGAAALCLIRYVMKFLKKKRQREEAARQAQLVSTLQESIPMSSTTTMTPTAPGIPMLEDKASYSTRATRPSSFSLYRP